MSTDFWEAEAAHWRRRAELLSAQLHEARAALVGVGYETPPEPPIGTTFTSFRHGWVYDRREDGWHCREGCSVCPSPWDTLWEYELSPAARAKQASRYGEPEDHYLRHVPAETAVTS